MLTLSRARMAMSALILAILAVGVVVSTGATAAHATPTSCPRYKFGSSRLDMKVENASFNSGARIIQMYPAPQATEFGWCTTQADGTTTLLVNERSNLCLTTDGVAGHWLTQERCDNRWGQVWVMRAEGTYLGLPAFQVVSYYYGLALDVYGDSRSDGAVIDGWYPHNGANQVLLRVDLNQ